MGNRAECPVCGAYSSDIYSAVYRQDKPCPYCDAPHEILFKWNSLKEQLEDLQEKKISKDLLKMTEETQKENLWLKSIIEKLHNKLCNYDNPLSPFVESQRILNSYKGDSSEEVPAIDWMRVPIRFMISLYKDGKISYMMLTDALQENFDHEGCIEKLKQHGLDPQEEGRRRC